MHLSFFPFLFSSFFVVFFLTFCIFFANSFTFLFVSSDVSLSCAPCPSVYLTLFCDHGHFRFSWQVILCYFAVSFVDGEDIYMMIQFLVDATSTLELPAKYTMLRIGCLIYIYFFRLSFFSISILYLWLISFFIKKK